MVCRELLREFSARSDIDVTYVMPFGPDELKSQGFRVLLGEDYGIRGNVKTRCVSSCIGTYMSKEDYLKRISSLIYSNRGVGRSADDNTLNLYGENLISEVYNFAEKAKLIGQEEDFDVIHAHDWTTFPAAEAISRESNKPFVVHVHITEFDKNGGQGADSDIYEIEKRGMEYADKVIAISNIVKNGLVKNYGIDPNKIEVIHNAKIDMGSDEVDNFHRFKDGEKVVLFAGRVTMQKGPEYFIEAAKKVLNVYDNVIFVMAGTGDQLKKMVNRVGELGLSDKFLFHGFYTRDEANKFFRLADVFVMPSVSEPFGLVPLEAMDRGTPTIISKQSGVSEILKNTLKVDFWDTDKMASQIVALLEHNSLNKEMSKHGNREVRGLTWDKPAKRCVEIYEELINKRGGA